MGHKALIWFISGLCFILLCYGVYLFSVPGQLRHNQADVTPSIQAFSVEEVVSDVAKYRGFMAIRGKVARSEDDDFQFWLVGEGRYDRLRVNLQGETPAEGSSVIVYGKMLLDEGERYVLEATICRADSD